MSEPASPGVKIALYGVSKTFRWEKRGKKFEVLALDGVNIEVRPNEFLCIIGPSGCGKTTLLRILASLTDVDKGEVRIDGRLVTKPGPERAMVFQQFGLLPWKTVLENVKFPLLIRKMDGRQATEIARRQLEAVGLGRFTDSHPHQLSGGMQQRVGLARALATNPEILLMDEPFGAIDAQTREYMQEQLLRLWSSQKKTVVFITHDIDEAVLLADRILVLTRGPGKVRAAVDVELPRPRWDYDVRGHPVFTEVRSRLWKMLREDLEAQEEEEQVRLDGGSPATSLSE